MTTGQIALVASLFAFPIVLIPLMFLWQWVYDPKRIVQEVERLLDLTSKGPVKLDHEWKPGPSNSRTLLIRYRVTLPEAAGNLTLSPEGAASGARALQGRTEQTIGDADFDDYFWVEEAKDAWLTPERRDLLIEIFRRFGPERVEKGELVGTITSDQAPWSARKAAARIEPMIRLVQELPHPSGLTRKPAQGWVSREKRRIAAFRLGSFGLLLFTLATPLGLLTHFVGAHPYFQILFACAALHALLLMRCGLAVLKGAQQALSFGRACQYGTIGLYVMGIPLGMFAAHPVGMLLMLLAGTGYVVLWCGKGYAALTRLRLEEV